MTSALKDRLAQALSEREAAGLLRRVPPPLTGQIDFCSNDYLGYARDIEVTSKTGGATGSRLISGNSELAEEVEAMLARFHRAEAALLFPSGYAANIGLLPAVATRHDTIIYDKLLHASLRDGIQLSRARALGFAHNNLDELQAKLVQATGQVFVVVESVYSMDGDVAPLAQLLPMVEAAGAHLIIDEAHGTGVLGPAGEGLVNALGLEDRVFARIHTFGKAIGSHGAVVLGSTLLREYLVNFARSFIYATALSEHTLAHIQAAYARMANGIDVQRLQDIIHYFLQACPPALRARLIPSTTPVQAVLCSGNAAVHQLAERLEAAGLAVLPIRYPTVPMGGERLRVCLHAYNTKEEVDLLIKKI